MSLTPIHDNVRQFWIGREERQALRQRCALTELRTKVMDLLKQKTDFFPVLIQKQLYFHIAHKIDRQFTEYMAPLIADAKKMQILVGRVNLHFAHFQELLKERCYQADVIPFIQEMHQMHCTIEHDLHEMKTQFKALTQQVEMTSDVIFFKAQIMHGLDALKNMEHGMIGYFGLPTASMAVSTTPFVVAPEAKYSLGPLKCYLTKRLFQQPVIIETGHTFERGKIKEYFAMYNHCPQTWRLLTRKSYIPNLAIQSIAQSGCFETALRSPVSGKLMQKPVVVSSGITYEEEEADELIAQGAKCPVLGAPLLPIKIPNLALRNLIAHR